jgi:D-alanyl-D-alanine carboxypeptidase
MHGKADHKFYRLSVFFPAWAGFCAAFLLAPGLAAARSDVKHAKPVIHHYAPADPAPADAGFGPTAPGVSAILIDARSGAVLSATGADTPRYPASLTKLMVLDLAFQALRDGRMTLDTPLPISAHAASVEPVKLGLQPGDSLTVRQAILAMTTMSANDAATALGEYLGGGSEYRCGQMMTLRAHVLGMAQSQFYNASGLPNPNQVSTARDLAILARDIVVSFPQDQPFFEVQQFDMNGHTVYSNNQMLKIYPGATGMKTGYTILARHNLITSAERNGRVLIGVVLHEPSWGQTYTQMTAMLDGGFNGNISSGTVVASNQPPPAYSPPAVTAVAPPAGLSLFPSADATTMHMPAPKTAARAAATPPAGGWIANVGSFKKMATARSRAVAVRAMRGTGVPRVAKIISHGKTLWTAQLAGLSKPAAQATCSALTKKGASCTIIAPTEHLASRASPSDS